MKKSIGKLLSFLMMFIFSLGILGTVQINNYDSTPSSIQANSSSKIKSVQEDYSYFDSFIHSIYNNNCPTLDISRSAAIPNQLSFIEAIAQLELQNENNLNNPLDSIFMYLPSKKYDAYNIEVLNEFRTNNKSTNLKEIKNSNLNRLNIFNNGESSLVEDFNNIVQ